MPKPALLVAATIAALATATHAAEPPEPMVVTALAAADFRPVEPNRPQGAAIAVLRGDPAKGPSTMLLRMAKGVGQLHIHTADYQLVVIEGDMKHWRGGDTVEAAAVLGPGGYWFQPGGQPHGDACLSERCLMLVVWSGPRDGRLADPAR